MQTKLPIQVTFKKNRHEMQKKLKKKLFGLVD